MDSYSKIIFDNLRKKYKEEDILEAFKEAKKIQEQYLDFEYNRFYMEQGYVTPEQEENLKYEDSDAWDRVEDILIDFIDKNLIIQEVTEERKQEIEKVREQSKVVEKIYNLEELFLKSFNEHSFYNEDNGKNLFYILLSLLTRDIKLNFLGNKVQNILHYFLVQQSGSGKDISFDYIEELIELINIEYKNTKEYKELFEQGKNPDKLIRVKNVSGSETMETYLDSFEVNHKGELGDIIPGILSTNDLILLRECSFLFTGSGSDGKQSKREIFLQAMEGRPVAKTLIKWKGEYTYTNCRASIVGATRPIANMKEHMANTGLQQRALNFMRNIDIDTRKKMNEKVSYYSFMSKEEKKDMLRRKKTLAKKFLEFRDFFKNTEFNYKDKMKLTSLIRDHNLIFYERIEKELFHNEHREIMNTFIGRFTGFTALLAVYNAAIRESNILEEIDVDRAIRHMNNNFDSIMGWVDEAISIDKDELRKMEKWSQTIKKCFEQETFIYKKDLVKKLEVLMSCSNSHAYKKVSQFSKMFKEGDKGLLSLAK